MSSVVCHLSQHLVIQDIITYIEDIITYQISLTVLKQIKLIY